MLSALQVQLPMPGCWALTTAILMQKNADSVKLTCPENQCNIMRRLENGKHKDLPATCYIYNLYYICRGQPKEYGHSLEGDCHDDIDFRH